MTNVRLLSALLFISGLCALVFQTAWFREFRLIFGSSTPASAAVLAIFMGGLGLGNAVLGRRVDAAASPLRMYGQLELAISVFAALSPFLVQIVRAVYVALGGQDALGTLGAAVIRLCLATLVLGLPTFLMGGTLPAAARAVTTAADAARRDIGWLYSCNTLGAVIGTLASTFVLLELLGNRQTLWLAAFLNFSNAVLAIRLAQVGQLSPLPAAAKNHSKPPAPAGKKPEKQRRNLAETTPWSAAQSATAPDLPPNTVYMAAAIVGFAFFLMELVWYRMLAAILGGTTFTFGLILAVALAGIGIGGALYPLLYRSREPNSRDLAATCGWEALALAVPFALGDRLAILAFVLQGLQYFGFVGQVLGWAVVAAIVIVPAAVVSGLQFPLLIALLGRGEERVGRQVGLAFAWNTVGAIAGSLAGGFGLVPLLSAIGAWKLVVILLILLTWYVMWLGYRRDRQALATLLPLALTGSAALCLAALGPTAVWRHSGIGAGRARLPAVTAAGPNDLQEWFNIRRRNIVWEADGAEVSVGMSAGAGVAFIVNGKSDGNSVIDAATQIMFPVIGALVHPDPRESLVIGLGTGESAGWLAAVPSMERVDVVELEPAIAHIAEVCQPLNNDVLRHPKVRTIYGDGREVVQTSHRQYDLIVSEPSNPYRAGVCSLFTLDFYHSARRRLKPDGLFLQWMQGYEVDVATMRMVLATLCQAFAHVEIWETKPDDLVLICSLDPLTYDAARLRERIKLQGYREALAIGWRTNTVEGVLGHFAANEKFVNRIVAEAGRLFNTDDRNLLEYRFARTVGRQGDFSMAGLRAEARAQGLDRPPRLGNEINWEEVFDQYLAMVVTFGDPPLVLPATTGARAQRAEALRFYVQDSFTAIAPAWAAQDKAPTDLAETIILALGYVHRGDEKAQPLIERLAPQLPVDARILTALLLYNQDKQPEAAAELSAALVAMRTDATALPKLAELAMRLPANIVQRDPAQAAKLYDALGERLAAWQSNERRLLTRCQISEKLSPGAAALAIAELEPNVPWEIRFLEMRKVAYEAIGHPLAARAKRDLETFRRYAPAGKILTRP